MANQRTTAPYPDVQRHATTAAQPLFIPAHDRAQQSRSARFMAWLRHERGIELVGWNDLRRWSVEDLDGFWQSIWDYFQVSSHSAHTGVLTNRDLPASGWFPGATINYAEHCIGRLRDGESQALIAHSETRDEIHLTVKALREQVARLQARLRQLGVGAGDRVVGYLPNIPEAVVAFLATAGLGAIWACCAPEFGATSVIERLGQLRPKVLLAISGYVHGAKVIDRSAEVEGIRSALSSLEHVIDVPYGPQSIPGALSWSTIMSDDSEHSAPHFEPVGFEHPLYVLFSSGTTGKPKAIVHGHGGMLLEHLKSCALHWDLGPGDRLLWSTSTAWMAWNYLVGALLVDSCPVLVDGSPMYPSLDRQWELVSVTRATHFATNPSYLAACRKEGVLPRQNRDLTSLRLVATAGSPLPAETATWAHDQLGDDVYLLDGSGGTDVCSALVQGSPMTPIWPGQIAGCALGVDAKAFDTEGNVVVDELGELVITAPMPSMPVGFWNDTDGSRYRAAYFEYYPGVWRHGDWVRFTAAGTCSIVGRSDATLNRGGVRIGTAEFYGVIEALEEISDSLVVHLEDIDGPGELLLFVSLQRGAQFTDALRAKITDAIRRALSPRHNPDAIFAVPSVPYNRTGKKLEVPVKNILNGAPVEAAVAMGAVSDPSSFDFFVEMARQRKSTEHAAHQTS